MTFNLNQRFADLQAELTLKLNRTTVNHGPTIGDQTELNWHAMLDDFLPNRYCVGNGFVADIHGDLSQQIDLLVFDRQYTPLVWKEGHGVIVPAESVYAAFEVKQALTKDDISYAAAKVESVRKLDRTSAPIVSNQGEKPGNSPKDIIGGLLTTASSWSPPFGVPFAQALEPCASGDRRLDIGCALDHGAWVIPPLGGLDALELHDAGDTLIFFALKLFSLLQRLGTVTAIDVTAWLNAAGATSRRLA